VATPADARTSNIALIALREDAGLSQQELADRLNQLAAQKYDKHPNVTKKTIGRWERGEVEWPQPFYRRLLAEYLDCAVDELGFRRPQRAVPAPVTQSAELLAILSPVETPEPHVDQDQKRWREVRATLGGRRRELAVIAEGLYPDWRIPGLEGAGLIAPPSWIPSEPVPLSNVVLDLQADTTPTTAPSVTGSERESGQVRPLMSADQRYPRYSHAVRDLARPRLFENRLCFRVMSVDWTLPKVQLQFGVMGFFDSMDTNEALAHETAMHHIARDPAGEWSTTRASWRNLSFRKLIGDPFDLRRRPLMGAVGTLTIRAGESPSMVLHQRDGARVAGGGSMIHLLPAGIFQPSSVLPESVANDFSIWRNIQREFAEELLGQAECDGSGRPIDYAALEPFASLDRALNDGRLRVHCLGLTLDALTLSGDLLTVAVFEPDLYDRLFGEHVSRNDEGDIPARAVPFESNTISQLRESGRLSPGATAAIHQAWRHRSALLS
jgi:transcriptional regulator with XRE-family HTH domain